MNDDDIVMLCVILLMFVRVFDVFFEVGMVGMVVWVGLIVLWNGWGVMLCVIVGIGDLVEMIVGVGGFDWVDVIDGIVILLGGNVGDGIWDCFVGVFVVVW